MNLEPIIQSEVSQREKKKKQCLYTNAYIQKDGTDETICSGDTDIENRLMDTAREGRRRTLEVWRE